MRVRVCVNRDCSHQNAFLKIYENNNNIIVYESNQI